MDASYPLSSYEICLRRASTTEDPEDIQNVEELETSSPVIPSTEALEKLKLLQRYLEIQEWADIRYFERLRRHIDAQIEIFPKVL